MSFKLLKTNLLSFICILIFISNLYADQDAVISDNATTYTLRMHIWEGHAPDIFVKKFQEYIEKKYNQKIHFKITYVTGSDDFYNLIRGGEVDIVMMTHHHFKDDRYQYIKRQLLLPLDIKNIPNFKNVLPTLLQAEHLFSNNQVFAAPVSQGTYGLAYNSSILKEEPKSWKILWDPKFKGKYVLGANEYIYNANITALMLGYPRESISDYDKLNNEEFKEKLNQLARNANSFWIGVDKASDLSGKTLATSWGDSMGPLNKMNEPWRIAEPIEGLPWWIDNYAITKSLKNKPFLKKVAEEYINELLSVDYQVNQILRTLSLTPIINIEKELTEKEKKKIHFGVPDFFEKNRILQHTYSQRDRNGLKLLWDEAISNIENKKVNK